MKTFKQFILEENERNASDSVFKLDTCCLKLESVLQLYGHDPKKFSLDYIYAHLGLDEKKIPREQLAKGLIIELEHADLTGGDPIETAKIAVAHIKEKKNYYDLLEKHVEK